MPLIVLVDGETASAAEVLAGALKENERAILVGQTTYGKGSIQEVMELKRAPAAIRITLAKLFSPTGQAYNGAGVAPHFYVERTSMKFDEQLRLAVQEAKSFALRR
jgi:carboxyl-terminal processing protease